MGLVCTNIEWVLECYPKKVFEWFEDKVVDDRRMADLDPAWAIRGETSKTAGNCAYGKCCIDKTKHNKVCFSPGKTYTKAKLFIHKVHFSNQWKTLKGIYTK